MKLFDVNQSGIVEHITTSNGKTIITKSQDVEAVLKENAEQRQSSSGWKGDFHKVASVPMIMVDIWRNELRAKGCPNINPLAKENEAFFMSKLKDYNYSKLRTKEGRL